MKKLVIKQTNYDLWFVCIIGRRGYKKSYSLFLMLYVFC